MRLSPFDDEEPPLDHANNIIDAQLYKDVARQVATQMVKTEDGSSLVWESRFKRKSWKLLDEGRSAQRVPEPDPLPSISFDTRPDPIQF